MNNEIEKRYFVALVVMLLLVGDVMPIVGAGAAPVEPETGLDAGDVPGGTCERSMTG